jgi:hypothetical protein
LYVYQLEEITMKKLLTISAGALVAIPTIGWVGLQVQPKPFPPFPHRTPSLDSVKLPADLPAPVARFFRTIIGERVPVIESAVITGRVRVCFAGLRMPARFRITHIAGQGYRHYIETTMFGYPLLKVNEHYLDGKGRLELPFGLVENEPKVDMAANLGLWAESVWLPSILVTDPRLRWEAIDDTSSHLIVPFGDEEDTFTAKFDPQTGLLLELQALRWKQASSESKVLWLNKPLEWQSFHGMQLPSRATVTWMDEGTPWSVWTVEDVVYNVDVSEYIRARGL